jgi:hypothetical protein
MAYKMNSDKLVYEISGIDDSPIPNYKLEHTLKLSFERLGA